MEDGRPACNSKMQLCLVNKSLINLHKICEGQPPRGVKLEITPREQNRHLSRFSNVLPANQRIYNILPLSCQKSSGCLEISLRVPSVYQTKVIYIHLNNQLGHLYLI